MKSIEQLLHERERVVLLNDQSQQFGVSSEIEDYRLVDEINESRPDIDNIINYVSASNLNLFVLCKKQDILAVLEVCSKKIISPNFITLNELEKMIAQGNKIENSCFLYYKCFHGCTLQTNKTYQIVVNANKIFEKQIYVNTITYYFLKPYYFGSTLGLAGYEDPCEGYDDILNDDFLYDGIAVYKDGKITKSDTSYFEVYEPYEHYDEDDNYTILSLENVEDDFETIENDIDEDEDELELYDDENYIDEDEDELELYVDENDTEDDTTQPEVDLVRSKTEKKKIAFIFIGLFIFGLIVGVSQSKEKILADRQAQEDQKIAAQKRLEAEKLAEEEKRKAKEEKKKAKEEKKKAKEEAKNKPEGVPNISERPADACSVQPSDKFWVPKAQVGELKLEKGPHVVTKEEEGAYVIPAGTIEIEMNWYCPQSQPPKLTISDKDKGALAFYVLEGETIYVLSSQMFTVSQSYTFPELERVAYKVGTLATDYTLPGRRYE